jgi:2Fe-2S type ferredoxin
MVETLGIALGALLTFVVVALHFTKGTDYPVPDDISQEVLEHRAETVPETEFPEPMNRSIGGGGAVPAGAVTEGEADGELGEGEAEAEEEDPSAIPDDEAEVYEVEYAKEGATIEVKENETLLEAGEEEGWDLPYACREGQCVSCGGRVTDGGNSEDYVSHHNQSMLGEAELDEGYTLTCVAYPQSDLTLETRETP